MHLALNAVHGPDEQGQPLIAISGNSPRQTVEGYFYPAEARELARQLVTIANDAEQGMRGEAVYSIKE